MEEIAQDGRAGSAHNRKFRPSHPRPRYRAKAADATLMKIKTEHVYPSIPTRAFDWSAYDDDTYDGPGSLIGYGPTKEAAIADLNEQVEEQR